MERGKVTLHQEIEKGRGSARQVAVIGGSASGFFTASLLARAGCSVEVLERSEELDPTPLSGFGVQDHVLPSRAVLGWSFWIKHLQRITAANCVRHSSVDIAPLTNCRRWSGSRSDLFPAQFRTISLTECGAAQTEEQNNN